MSYIAAAAMGVALALFTDKVFGVRASGWIWTAACVAHFAITGAWYVLVLALLYGRWVVDRYHAE